MHRLPVDVQLNLRTKYFHGSLLTSPEVQHFLLVIPHICRPINQGFQGKTRGTIAFPKVEEEL